MSTIALDLDRVLFDTNKYFISLRERFKQHNLDFSEVVRKSEDCGRKDLTTMVNIVSEDIGKVNAEKLFFDDVHLFWEGGVAEIFDQLRTKFDKIFVITVGDGYQSKKITGLDIDGIFVVDCDHKKIEIASALHKKYPDLIFIDDKLSVVKEMDKLGIKTFQALWFLDEKYRQEKFDTHFNKAIDILEI